MAGILNGSIAACRRTTFCLRFLRPPYGPLNLCQSLATQQHDRRRTHSSSCGSGDENGRDQLNQLKSIQKEQPAKGSGGLEVTATPPNPQGVPGEKTKESPREVRPGQPLPLEAQPSHMPLPLEVKPQHPHTIICSSDSKASTLGNEVLGGNAAKVIDTIEDPRNQDLSSIKSELTSEGSSKTEVTLGQAEAKNEQKSQALPLTKAETKSQDWLQAEGKDESKAHNSQAESQNPHNSQAESQNPQVNQLTSSSSSQPQSGNPDSAQSPRPETVDPFGCEYQGSSFRFPEEGQIASQEAGDKTLINSSAPGEKMPETADTIQANLVDSEIIDQWVDQFKQSYMAEKAAFGLDNENEVTVKQTPEIPSSASNDEKTATTMVKINNVWVLRDSNTAKSISSSSEPGLSETLTEKSSPGPTLPLKIVAMHEAPTEFKQLSKELLPSEMESDKDAPTLPLKIVAKHEAPTEFKPSKFKELHPSEFESDKYAHFDDKKASAKPLEFIIGQLPKADLKGITEGIVTMLDSDHDSKVIAGDTPKSGEIPTIVQEKPPVQATEEIVEMFKKDFNADLVKTEDARVQEILDAFDGQSRNQDPVLESSKSSQAGSGSEKTGDSSPNVMENIDQSGVDPKLPKLEESIVAKKDAKVPKKKDNSDNDSTIQGGIVDSAIQGGIGEEVKKKEDQVISKLADKDQDKSFDQTSFDLAEKISSFIKSANEPDGTRKEPSEKEKSSTNEVISILRKNDQKEKPKPATTSMLPGDLYDPVSSEVSTKIQPESRVQTDESEDLNPGLEAPEVRAGARKEAAKVAAPQAKDETKSKEDEKASAAEKLARKDKPKLEEGELSMKLVDKASAGMPASGAEIPGSATASQSPAEKNLIQKIFDKILGRSGKREGKRHMSTSAVQRQLSTSCTFPVEPRLVSESISELHEVNSEPTPDHEAPVNSTIELFAKDKKDLTEIKGGAICSDPKKTPRELLQEKEATKNVKILGGSEECAKKMKRLKELTKDDDDCDHFSHSLSQFLRQLRVSLRDYFIGVTEQN